MSHRTPSSESSREGQQAPFAQRLWRNQHGIIVAIVLTLAAAGILMASCRG